MSKATVTFKCIEGSARVYRSRSPSDYETITAGGSIEVPATLSAVTLPVENITDDIKAAIMSSWVAPGIGQNGREKGKVSAVPSIDMVIREYLQTDNFMDPDADTHVDHTVQAGKDIERDVVGSNAVTLLAMKPA